MGNYKIFRKLLLFFCVLMVLLSACGKPETNELPKIEIQVETTANENERPDVQINTNAQIEEVESAEKFEQEEKDTSKMEVETKKDEEEKNKEDVKNSEVTKTANKSILDFLNIAIKPVGNTMYVWGGGWNEEDTAAGIEAVTLGVSARWAEFAAKQDASYDYNTTQYQIHDGLDCSGYVGWAVYNVLETQNGQEGYVLSSSKMAQNYANRGLGTYISAANMTEWRAGDIMSMNGHVWIVVGMCDDGSVLFLHSSPPGVSFCGTNLANGNKSQAVALAEQIMKNYYPGWYLRYPECSRSYSYLTGSSAMRWSRTVLSDDEGLCEMSAEEIVGVLF